MHSEHFLCGRVANAGRYLYLAVSNHTSHHEMPGSPTYTNLYACSEESETFLREDRFALIVELNRQSIFF